MNHWVVAPVVLPLAGALALLFAERFAPRWSGAINLAATLALLAVALKLLAGTAPGEVAVYLVGNWPASVGIALAVDRLGALMITLAAALALCALGFALTVVADDLGADEPALEVAVDRARRLARRRAAADLPGAAIVRADTKVEASIPTATTSARNC